MYCKINESKSWMRSESPNISKVVLTEDVNAQLYAAVSPFLHVLLAIGVLIAEILFGPRRKHGNAASNLSNVGEELS